MASPQTLPDQTAAKLVGLTQVTDRSHGSAEIMLQSETTCSTRALAIGYNACRRNKVHDQGKFWLKLAQKYSGEGREIRRMMSLTTLALDYCRMICTMSILGSFKLAASEHATLLRMPPPMEEADPSATLSSPPFIALN